MGNCCGGGTPVGHESTPDISKPSPGVSRGQSPARGKTPPPAMAMPPVRDHPKVTAPVTAHKLRSIPPPPHTGTQKVIRSVPAAETGWKTPPETRKKVSSSPAAETGRKPAAVTGPKDRPVPAADAGRKPTPGNGQKVMRPIPAAEAVWNKTAPENGQKAKPIPVAEEAGLSGGAEVTVPPSGKIVTPNLKMFTLVDLKSATRNFRPDTMLGEGGFGRVFKGWVDDMTLAPSKVGVGIPVAVKKSNPDSLQGLHEWQSEVRFLGKFHHPNLVKLLGYCWEENQFLLVYEYMPRGSLENHLFTKGAEPLSWDTRLKIAIGAAQGLAFLHNSEKSVIYRDFKASNILLDSSFNAKLSDFGLAKLGPVNGNSHVTTRVMGTYGYAAPEYMATGHLYVRSDVYGFGVVLLEILTGLRALDTNRPTAQQNLIEWAKPCLAVKDKRKLKKMMDPRLEHKYPIETVVWTAGLIAQCLESDPKNRPSMDDVLIGLREIRAIRDEPEENRKRGNETNGRHNRSHGSKTGRIGRTSRSG